MIHSKELNFYIYENSRLGTEVGDLKPLLTTLNIFLSSKTRFSIQDSKTNPFGVDYFAINSTVATINTNTEIDREQICPEISGTNLQCTVSLIFMVENFLVNTFIHILDQNDNKPQFPVESKTIRILESESIGYSVKLDQAIDMDSSENGVYHYSMSYSVEKDKGYFKLNRSVKHLSLILIRPLDYETIQEINCNLVACDRGVPQLCSSQHLTISIININDEAPIFQNKNYSKVIKETLSPGSEILRVQAYDRETGLFGRIKYQLSNKDDVTSKYIFVDPKSGSVFLKRSLINMNKLTFIVEAHDDSEDYNTKFDWTMVTLHIIDINNNKPNISINSHNKLILKNSHINSWYIIDMFENNPINQEIAFINVVDIDQGNNGDISCDIEPNDSHFQKSIYLTKRVRLNKNTFQYKVKSQVSFDRENIYSASVFKIRCKDKGINVQESIIFLQINILDRNEYPVKFNMDNYTELLYEEMSNRTIFYFSVSDKDIVSKNRFEISLPVKSPSYLRNCFQLTSINRYSGELMLVKPIDREKIDKVILLLTAINNAEDDKVFTTVTTVSLEIKDINDNDPQYVGAMSWNLSENVAPAIEICKLNFSDPDVGSNGQVQVYAIKTQCFGSHLDEINHDLLFNVSNDNVLESLVAFDYESIKFCRLTINFHDNGEPRRHNKVSIIVNILDVNDNDPIWVYPSLDDSVVNISILSIVDGGRITRVRAIDQDTINQGHLTYDFINNRYPLLLNRDTGEIFSQNNKYLLPVGWYNLSLVVNDNGIPNRNATANLILHIFAQNAYSTSFNPVTGVILTIILIPTIIIIVAGCFIVPVFLCLRRKAASSSQRNRGGGGGMLTAFGNTRFCDDGGSRNGDRYHRSSRLCSPNSPPQQKDSSLTNSLEKFPSQIMIMKNQNFNSTSPKLKDKNCFNLSTDQLTMLGSDAIPLSHYIPTVVAVSDRNNNSNNNNNNNNNISSGNTNNNVSNASPCDHSTNISTSVQNPYFVEQESSGDNMDSHEKTYYLPETINPLYWKLQSTKPPIKTDCEVCSSADSGQGASEEEIHYSTYKAATSTAAVKTDKSCCGFRAPPLLYTSTATNSTFTTSGNVFPPLLEEDRTTAATVISSLSPHFPHNSNINNISNISSNNRSNNNNINNCTNSMCFSSDTSNSSINCNCLSSSSSTFTQPDSATVLSILQCPLHSQILPFLSLPTNQN